MISKPDDLSRTEIKAVFRRHRGAKAQLARELGVRPVSVSHWFSGRARSKRIDLAIRQRAAELINAERQKAKEGSA